VRGRGGYVQGKGGICAGKGRIWCRIWYGGGEDMVRGGYSLRHGFTALFFLQDVKAYVMHAVIVCLNKECYW